MKARKVILIVVLAALLLTAGFAVLLLNGEPRSHVDILQTNWGVTIPLEAGWHLNYGNDRRDGFHGDGLSYHVYGCENGTLLDDLFDWHTTKTPHKASEDWLDELGVPADLRPPYTDCGMKRMTQSDGSELLLFWDSANKLLYVVESYM